MTVFYLVCQKYKLHPLVVFALALLYNEMYWHNKKVIRYYHSFLVEVDKDTVRLNSVPDFVENYCLDVMAGRTKVPEFPKWKGDKKRLEGMDEEQAPPQSKT